MAFFDNYQKNVYKKFCEEYLLYATKSLEKGPWQWYYSEDVIETISDYLAKCFSNTRKKESLYILSDKRNELLMLYKEMTENNQNGLFSKAYQDLLQHNRNRIIRNWKNRDCDPFMFQ